MHKRRFRLEPDIPKHQQVFESLSRDILTGKYQPGQRIPSEAALSKQFGASRITIGRALRDMTTRGLIDRIAGSGTFVKDAARSPDGYLFGLIIPDLGQTEIFDPICQGIANAPAERRHALLWGNAAGGNASRAQQALMLCDQYIASGVSGVFFAPLENAGQGAAANLEVVSRLEGASIPVVLLDRCVLPFPQRCAHDLVGIDNRLAGFLATTHLLMPRLGPVAFLASESGAATVDARIAGYREAMHGAGRAASVHRLSSITAESVVPLLAAAPRGAGFVCQNDRIAGQFLQLALAHGYPVPDHVRIVGIDDVEYASLLPIPLTTVRQPCREIGEAALAAMLLRQAHPRMVARDILLACKLIIRQSCGGNRAANFL